MLRLAEDQFPQIDAGGTVGALQLVELKELVWTQHLAAAASMEGFCCNLDAISETVNNVHARPGQTRVAARLRKFLGIFKWQHG